MFDDDEIEIDGEECRACSESNDWHECPMAKIRGHKKECACCPACTELCAEGA